MAIEYQPGTRLRELAMQPMVNNDLLHRLDSSIQKKNIVLVDDNDLLRSIEAETLEADGYNVYSFGDYDTFARTVDNGLMADAYVIDGEVPLRKGDRPEPRFPFMVLKIRHSHPDARIILKSAQGYEEEAKRLRIDVLPKASTGLASTLRDYLAHSNS